MKTRYRSIDTEEDPDDATRPRLRRRGDGSEYLLGDETLVGRGLECDILISDSDSISRRHAQVFSGADGLSVTDLGSTNGTHLNGTEVTERTVLNDGDVLAFDEYEFDVVIPPPPPPVPVDDGATRLVSRDETMTRADRLALETLADAGRDLSPAEGRTALDEADDRSSPGASPGVSDPSGEEPPRPSNEPFDSPSNAESADVRADESTAWPSRSVADEMGDDRSWPEIEDDAPEPILEFDDEPSASPVDEADLDAGRERANASGGAEPSDPRRAEGDSAPHAARDAARDAAAVPSPEPRGSGMDGHDPIDSAPSGNDPLEHAPLERPSAAPAAPTPAASAPATPAPSATPPAPASAPEAPAPATPAPAAPPPPAPAPQAPAPEAPAAARPVEKAPAEAPRAEREESPRPAAPAARPAADIAPPAEGRQEAAAVPGAWANAADVQGAAGHTMIVKYVAPRRKAPPPIDPETLDGPAMVVGTDDPAGEVLPLDDGVTEWIVGSGRDSDLYIDDDGVSKRHAVLSREGNKWRLCDELSANGTYVNGNRLNIGYVGDGDALRFGSVECRLVIPKGGRAKPARGRAAKARPGAQAERKRTPERAPSAPFPWKPVVITLLVVLVLAAAAAAAFFLIPRG